MQKLAYITVGNIQEAKEIAHQLVKKRLAACCNLIPQITSVYEWQNQIHEDSEVLLLAKTSEDQASHLIACVRELHSYDCPCITVLDLVDGNPEFLNWIDEQTNAKRS